MKGKQIKTVGDDDDDEKPPPPTTAPSTTTSTKEAKETKEAAASQTAEPPSTKVDTTEKSQPPSEQKKSSAPQNSSPERENRISGGQDLPLNLSENTSLVPPPQEPPTLPFRRRKRRLRSQQRNNNRSGLPTSCLPFPVMKLQNPRKLQLSATQPTLPVSKNKLSEYPSKRASEIPRSVRNDLNQWVAGPMIPSTVKSTALKQMPRRKSRPPNVKQEHTSLYNIYQNKSDTSNNPRSAFQRLLRSTGQLLSSDPRFRYSEDQLHKNLKHVNWYENYSHYLNRK